MPSELPADLRADLLAAAQDSAAYHHDLCGQFRPGLPGVCTCGAPRLFRRLAAVLVPESGAAISRTRRAA